MWHEQFKKQSNSDFIPEYKDEEDKKQNMTSIGARDYLRSNHRLHDKSTFLRGDLQLSSCFDAVYLILRCLLPNFE